MKTKLNLTLLICILISANCFSQQVYYKINGEKIKDVKNYESFIISLAKKGKIEECKLKTVIKNDSVINFIKISNLITTADGLDPWGETKKFIGKKFQIENYIHINSKNFDKNYLQGKPTIVNFWFTRCPPCIEELPVLNELKEKYGNEVNFISVTFDTEKAVNEFLKKHKFNFLHIVNSKKQIDKLKISAYPTSFILDNNGIIKIVLPEISKYDLKDIDETLSILK